MKRCKYLQSGGHITISKERINKKYNQYCFGFRFNYGYQGEETVGYDYSVDVNAIHSSLKEELISNKICRINMRQFKSEYNKAINNFNGNYCKHHFIAQHDASFTVENVLALMVYCNFTQLQYLFTKTYRENDGADHHNFYHLGKWIKIAVNKFGTRVCHQKVKAFYHGIGEKMILPRYIHQVQIYGPLSTTSSFSVALNFTNRNNGLILQFGDINNDWGHSAKCLSLEWLSDYQYEAEYLFIQSGHSERLVINDIVDPQTGYYYGIVLKALRIFHYATYNYMTNVVITDVMKECIIGIITAPKKLHATDYLRQLINVYCDKKRFLRLDYIALRQSQFSFLVNLMFYDCQWIKLQRLLSLFSNLRSISIINIKYSSLLFETMLQNLEDIQKNLDDGIKISIAEIYTCGNAYGDSYIIKRYRKRFDQIGFRIEYDDFDDALTVSCLPKYT